MSIFNELKRRNVFRVGAAYAIVTWLLLQLSDILVPLLNLPESAQRFVLLLLVIGFVPALFFAWAFELTPEGIKKEKDVDRDKSIAPQTGRKLDRTIIIVLVLALGYFAYDKFVVKPGPDVEQTSGEQGPSSIIPEPTQSSDVAVFEKTDQPSVPDQKSIAVLPFTTRSTSEEDRFFSDGMHDDLLTQLAKIGSLKVISRTSVMEYRDTTKNLTQIGHELGVANILEGAVQRAGSQVRINVQLIDVETDEHLWAETYDRELSVDNLLKIQSEIAHAITGELQATLSPREQIELERKLTDNLEAMAAYRNAKILSNSLTETNLARAETEILHALELDPAFAAAWAELAHINLGLYWNIEQRDELLITAREAIDRGRAISPDLPELDIAEGYYHYWGFRNYAKALEVLEPVLETYPNDTDLLKVLAYVNRRHGNIDNAIDYLKQAHALAPRDTQIIYVLAKTYTLMRQFDETQIWLDMYLRLNPNTSDAYDLQANLAASRDGDYKTALRFRQLALGVDPSYYTWVDLIYLEDYERAFEVVERINLTEDYERVLSREMLRGLTFHYSGNTAKAQPLLIQAKQQLEGMLEEQAGNFGVLTSLCSINGALEDTAQTLIQCEAARNAVPDDMLYNALYLEDIAAGLAMGGQHDKALDFIEIILNSRTGPSYNQIRHNPGFSSLHELERWKQMVNQETRQ